ncbi:transglycosylase SLT domain-containing protein [Streptomyces sp. HNM0575]|uniref:aggregation-promoting factor C-terminal-like domain-containing protein n=1 Tax=Streptomyces sp. HNM0575 TaxID=2716338 RepID=UPI00145E9B4C|nr:transglycosylase SLT domain-containing protein [Streptomyces sp. HNM0575]NLU74801.1 transglycosylase SLT domain-containing protein [Streptomyces sp. HNM0575]
MSVPNPERHGRLSRLHKISAATGAAAVGVTAFAFTVVPGQKSSGSVTAGSEMAAKPVALQTAADGPAAQKVSIDAQTSAADDRARAHAKAEARKKAEARAEARQQAAKKAERDRERRLAASRSAERTKASPSGSPKQVARQIIGSETQFQCFSQIVERESGWNIHAQNPSGAYGLVQALPGSKMSSAGPDWRNNAATQVKWGLNYMKDRYGSPCGAWSFWQSNNWY